MQWLSCESVSPDWSELDCNSFTQREHSNDRFQSLLTISRTPLIKEAKTRKDGKKAMFNTADWAFSKLSHKLPCQVALKRKLRIQNPPIKLLHGNRVSMILLQIAMKVKQKMSQLWAFDLCWCLLRTSTVTGANGETEHFGRLGWSCSCFGIFGVPVLDPRSSK